MKKILATAAVLAFAGSAYAGSFVNTSSIDFGGGIVDGAIGSPLTWDGAASIVPGGFGSPAGIWNGNPAQTGVTIATPDFSFIAPVSFADLLVPGQGNFNQPGQFAGAWFSGGGAQTPSSEITIDGNQYQAILLANFDSGVSNINFTTMRIGLNEVRHVFNGFDQLGTAFNPKEEAGNFSITLVDNGAGGNFMYAINGVIPTPGAAGLLGLAGLAAVRRRR